MEAVLNDVDGQVHVAVSPVLDPLAELQRGHGRFLYFAPDEIEPLAADPPGTGPAAAQATVTPSRGGTNMISKLIKAALVAALLAVVVQSLPDVQRYLELREM